jgi:hypothetical protein
MTAAMRYLENRERLAGDVAAGRVQPTIEGLSAAFEKRGGYSPFEAACNAERFLSDVQRHLERRTGRHNLNSERR